VHGEQAKLVQKYGAKGRQILKDLQVYSDGINGYRKSINNTDAPWTIDDCLAVTAFIGSIFGNGGGDEVRLDDFLGRLRAKLGVTKGSEAFTDLTEANDPEAPTTAYKRFPYGNASAKPKPGSPLVDVGTLDTKNQTSARRKLASNFLLVDKSRSATGEPMAVMGPQLGYYDPEIVVEADIHAPGVNAQGAFVPGGGPYMLLGRTKNYAWSLTTATNDNTDEFLEKLCGPGGRAATSYMYRGKCKPMETFDAGTLKGTPLRYHVTVHGPVQGTVLVKGQPYAIAKDRSTYGQDGNSIAALADMTQGRGSTVKGFYRSANEFGFTFNWAYASRQHIAYFSSGLLPIRAKGTNKALPTLGTGPYDWRGFLPLARHPHQADPKQGTFTNWNNKPAPGWQAGEDNLSYGSVHRVEDFRHFKKKNTIQDVVSIMNKAATEDLVAAQVWPVIRTVLNTGKAPDALSKQAEQLVTKWAAKGAPRLDADLNGTYDDPGVAILDSAFTKMATNALGARLGDLTTNLSDFINPDSIPSFGSGWYGYVDKDLRTLLHPRSVRGKFKLSYCGLGSLKRCRAELWAGLQSATKDLAAKQGNDPTKWRQDATSQRISFSPGLISDTMRWTDRPTFQQVLRFGAK
jgi:acyl-homoserine lactone acylase PvdQ